MALEKYNGCIMFNGEIRITLKKKEYKLHTTLLCDEILNADPEREVVMLLQQHLRYNEADIGYIVAKGIAQRPKDKGVCNANFGLKSDKKSNVFSVYNTADVIAWGYADE